MHAPESCDAACSCACPPCQLAGEHSRHAGPLTAPTERDPVTPQLDVELGNVRCCNGPDCDCDCHADPELDPANCDNCTGMSEQERVHDWSSGHQPGSPVAELAHR